MPRRRFLAAIAAVLCLARDGAAQEQGRGRAVLAGVVSDAAGGRVAGATVRLDGGGGTALTDDEGRFILGALPAGHVGATVRHIGFLPADFELDLPAGTRVEVSVRLIPSAATLPTLVVDGERRELTLQANGFYERARVATGRFLRPEFLDARRGVPLSTILREVPRVTMRCEFGGMRCRATVGPTSAACEPRVWVDGMPAPDGALDELVPRDRVRGVEVYASAGFLPGDFLRPGDTCGAIAIWTDVAPTWSRYLPRQKLRLPPPDSARAGVP